MDFKALLPVFTAVFIAELGDKTQIATMLFAADQRADKFGVFLAASLALIVATAIGVAGGCLMSRCVNPAQFRYAAGAGFIVKTVRSKKILNTENELS